MEDGVRERFAYEERTVCICGQSLSDSVGYVCKNYPWGAVKFVRCKSCGSWCQSPQIALESLKKWFDSPDYQGSASKSGIAYVNYLDDESSRLEDARSRYGRDLMGFLPRRSRVLELGCATGTLLSVLRDYHGCEVTGLDLSPKFVAKAKDRYNIDVLLGDLNNFSLPENYFDSIILLGTIGNLQNLHQYLIRFRKLLKHTGLLIFNYTDAESPIVKYLYRSKLWMFSPSVNCFMSNKGCRAALDQAGFHLVSICNDKQRPSLQKLLNHARLNFALPLLKFFRLEHISLPIAMPIPSVKLVKAKC
jgi:SAM-dependent methyltransferase